ncbi:MAG: DNA-directed RNA polymerase subunit beta' [Flavobacteriales bacterium]|jgi:DNA-directed RNA polymerase subunit beta'|nr:DNA-directed RNA polymerase subunit beta' [Flavobacteriales bacterium]MDP4716917.1 DNA-directed RNA polymerase subunit beta' [Flavobacteriales bacterium]
MLQAKKVAKPTSDFKSITISLASPEEILERSSGEVMKPETINYRTYKPEREGLFCEKIFGPVKDYECHCGKYKRIRYKGIVCDRCGVEVTEKKVRRERMGHISLTVPVAHIWYFRSLPNKIGYLLGMPSKKLDQIIYYERYVVINAGPVTDAEGSGLEAGQFLTEEEYLDIQEQLPRENQYLDDKDPNKFVAKMGAEALHDLLARLDLDALSFELRDKANRETSQQRKNEALKRLSVVESFRDANTRVINRPEWMITRVVPVIPPELRPLVPLDGGRFATSDLNDLYRRVIIRNNRLKRLLEIKAPDVILRNEKRMLQEAVDSLFDNSRKSSAVKTESNRPLKSLSDSLKGKQGRFRQNLLGKRVDYSARSVIVVGPELKLHECGLPKDMAAELFKPFIIRKMIERGIVKTVKSAKKIVDKKEAIVWDILENILKGHPVLLNRAPTLHRLGIQSFQPKLIEGKAIQLHPLVCTAFNADFDGDQMAVHVPLGSAAILEAQLLMLGSHNILNPANGAPITVPSQDMVLGLYYISKGREGTDEKPCRGEGRTYYSKEEVIIAFNEGQLDLHAFIKVRWYDMNDEPSIIETTAGRVLFNAIVPPEVGFINQLLTKKALRDIIGNILKIVGIARAAKFLDDMKDLGYYWAFKGGLSFKLTDVVVPNEKEKLVGEATNKVAEVFENYNMGLITNNERYNQIIDIWTNTNSRLTNILMDRLKTDQQGFNSIYMMYDSGARGSKEQIRQLAGMRGLMAKPQKNAAAGGQDMIENPILANFKEGLSILEYFISTHGARKGLADTALKTADAGYLTRRLVDVAQDVIINEVDCGTLRGLNTTALKKSDEVVESLRDRILGRTSVHDVYHPETNELLVEAVQEISEEIADAIEAAGIEEVEIRSVLTCESKRGVCAKCYGRDLASARLVQEGLAVGVIAAQSIGEPGTQLTLRTFHTGGAASGSAIDSDLKAKYAGIVEIEDLRTVERKENNVTVTVVVARSAELKINDEKTGITMATMNLPYGSILHVNSGDIVKKNDVICEFDPFNSVIITEEDGTINFDAIEEGITFKTEVDEQTGFSEKIIIETKDKKKNPSIEVVRGKEVVKVYSLPVGAHLNTESGTKITKGSILAKIPRMAGRGGDITGGLPRVTELFEARNPSNPANVAEIDGIVEYGKIKRGNREIILRSRTGEEKKYLINLAKHILVQDGDFVRAGMQLSDGAISPGDILDIQGPTAVQEYLVNEIQEVYRLQGVKINDKHFEVIVRQMMRKVEILDAGDTRFLQGSTVDKAEFIDENDLLFDKVVVTEAGDSEKFLPGQVITALQFRTENSELKRKDRTVMESREAITATARPILQGITRASLQTDSWISAASFQETTKVLNEAAVQGKTDFLNGLKENVIVGHPIPAGSGSRRFQKMLVGNSEDLVNIMAKGGANAPVEEA